MNQSLSRLFATILAMVNVAQAQGTFSYDQQATNLIEGVTHIQAGQPMGQSFTPSLSAVDFVTLSLLDANALQSEGVTMLVNLRSVSITGPILGVSGSLYMTNNFFGIANFFFASPVAVTAGTRYYFELLVLSGDNWASRITDSSYGSGSVIYQGVEYPGNNLWFREGIVVPEPSAAFLILAGVAMTRFIRRPRT